MRLVVITGLSGSGKSVALRLLEDAGFYCIDNLPAVQLPETVSYLEQQGIQDAAVSVDARSGSCLERMPEMLATLRARVDLRILFLDASDAELVRRFSETRRRHPLSTGERSLEECLRGERDLLADLVAQAYRLDTTELSANALRTWVKDWLDLGGVNFTLVFESFGFKHGIPLDADLVFDVRCLPNPHYAPDLRPLTGRDAAVIAFLEAQLAVGDMLNDIQAYVGKWLPAYIQDNRAYFTVALGCTGGQHRSVYFAETLARRFPHIQQVLVRHRGLA